MAYKRIVFGTDGSARAASVGETAAAIARSGKAELVVAHVYSRPEGAEGIAAVAVEAATQAGVEPERISTEVCGGVAADELVRIASQRDAGLIVISGGRGQRYTLGQVAYRLSHAAPCDLLIVADRPHAESIYERILIATDGSATADRAARKGYDLAESLGSKVTLAFVTAMFPIIVNTVIGMRQTPPELVYLMRSLRASELQIFLKIRLYAAAPYIFAGFKIGITLAVVGAIVGEFIASNGGLGFLLLAANNSIDTPLLFAIVVVLSVLSIALYYAVEALEVLLLPRPLRSKGARLEQRLRS